MSEDLKREYFERYQAAAHAVQSGVKMEIDLAGEAGAAASPKHLRVGVNSAMVDASAIARLLIAKGVIDELEYYKALAEMMEAEQARYEKDLGGRIGKPVRLV